MAKDAYGRGEVATCRLRNVEDGDPSKSGKVSFFVLAKRCENRRQNRNPSLVFVNEPSQCLPG